YGQGLYFKSRDSDSFISYSPGMNNSIPDDLVILDLLVDDHNRLWIATYGDGAYLLDLETANTRHFIANKSNPYALHYDDILCLYEDSAGTIWLGTDGAGLSYYDEFLSKFNVLTNSQLPPDVHVDQIRSIAVETNRTIWLGTSGKGLTRISPDRSQIFSFTSGNSNLASDRIMSLHYSDDSLLIGLQAEGLQQYTDGTFKSYSSLDDQTIWRILHHSSDSFWICTRDSGLILFSLSEGIMKQFNSGNSEFKTNNIRTIEKHSDQEYWVGTEDSGVYRLNLDNNELVHIVSIPEKIKSLFDDGQFLWVGTNGNGMLGWNYQNDKLHKFTTEHGLPNNVIYGILPGTADEIWVSSNRGISRFSYSKIDSPDIINYSNYDGLQAFEFNTGAYVKDQEGVLYFGGLDGLNWFNPENLTFNQTLPNTVITSLELFNQSHTLEPNQSFNHNENTLTFSFAGLHFSQPERNQYRYRLTDHDAEWIDAGNSNIAHYTNLAPGEYEFQVISSNYDGQWNEQPAIHSFIIKNPWYATNLAYAFYTLMVLLTALLIYRYLKWRWQMKMQLQLEHAETERLKKLDEFKTKLYTNISHEFRTPLTLITGPVNHQLARTDLKENDRMELNLVKRNSKRLLNLVNQLLDLSKLESGSVRLAVSRGNLSALINQIIAAFQFEAREKGLSFESEIELCHEAYFDQDVIEKTLGNLLSNAIKYSPQNGFIKVRSSINDGQLVFSVVNNGNTLKKEDLPRLFKRFYQTSKSSEGVGVGLALVRELATLSHGQVLAQISEPDLIQFTLTMPIERSYFNKGELAQETLDIEKLEELAIDDKSMADASGADSEKPVLLIIEDDKDVRQYIISIFNDDYNIIDANNGTLGYDKAINSIPDLIISDIMMPGIDGLDLCSQLKEDERTSHIPIVLLTAKVGDEHEIEGLKTGADAYVTKPFRADKLQIQVNQLIEIRRRLRNRYNKEFDVSPKDLSITSADQRFFERAQQILDKHLTEPSFNADQFARNMAMSRMQLHRKLKALTGLSTSEFIRSQRIKLAAKLLRQSDMSVSELAYEIGFNTPSYFIKCFKEIIGQTPLEYQKEF
ncbi:MAG: response regulator, partial [Flavobacteriaceae bacterium]|nr:response regulator [Flavobacteriaceae bacterium]